MAFVYWLIFLVFRPIMFVFHVIIRLLWYPDVKPPRMGHPDYSLKSHDFSHDISKYYTGDGAKFIGQAYSCYQTTEIWDQVTLFWDFDKKHFFRFDKPKRAFSGDMMAGMVLAIATRHREGKLTDYEKKFLADVAWSLAFKSWVPFKFNHKDGSRGYFWTPWSPAMNCIFQVLCVLKWGYSFETNKLKKGILFTLYWLLFISNIPLFLFGMYDHNVFVKRIYACWWYGTHSDLLSYTAGAIEKIPFARYGIGLLDKRYGHMNADIAAVAFAFTDKRTSSDIVYTLIADLVKSRDGSTFIHNKRKYYSVRGLWSDFGDWARSLWTLVKGFKLKDIWNHFKTFKTIFGNNWKDLEDTFNGGFQCHDRTWERNQQDRGKPHSNIGDLDIVFPLRVVEGCFDKFNKK